MSVEKVTGEFPAIAAAAFDALPARIAVVDAAGLIVAVNRSWRAFAHLHGASDADACEGRNYFDVCDAAVGPWSDDARRVANGLRQVLQGRLPAFTMEYPSQDGEAVAWTSVGISRAADGPSGALAVIAYDDITARKDAEQRLVESAQALERAQSIVVAEERARLRTLLDTIPDAVWLKDIDGRFVAANAAFAALLGVSESEVLGRTEQDFFPPHMVDGFHETDASAISSGRAVRFEEQLPPVSGKRPVVLQTIKTPMFAQGRLVGVLGIARDISELRHTMEALRTAEQQREFALDAAQFGTWHRAPGAETVTLDRRAMALWDVDESEVPLDTLRGRVHPDDWGKIEAPRLAGTPGRHVIDFRIRRRDGAEAWLLSHVQLMAESGRADDPLASHGTVQDITDRKRTEEMVARFVAASPVVIYALGIGEDGATSVRWFSGNLQALTGWTDADVHGTRQWWARNLHPDDRERVLAYKARALVRDHSIEQFRFRRADGSYIWLRDEKKVLRDADGRPCEVVGSWADVTERVALEAQVRQAHKLEAIGLLAGGIAHDFNNLLTVICGNSDLLAILVADRADAQELLDDIRGAGERAAALTRQLLAFGRSQVLAPQIHSVNQLVSDFTSILTHVIGTRIRLECVLDDSAGHVRVDANQLEQVLLNLTVNARDAMPDGGVLRVQTGGAVLDEAYARVHADVPPGQYAMVRMTDTGVGMTPDVLARIFEPFFTTKPQGQGTGLGLAMAFGIVKQSGGHIDVASEPGVGTTFNVYLPTAGEELSSRPTNVLRHRRRGGPPTVLLVEDDESVRKLARVALERSGYTVLTASDGSAALDLADREPTIDLLVTDVAMPKMRGPDLARALRQRRPGLKVLFISGYVQDAGDRLGLAESDFLVKPFSLDDLARKVREVLEEPGGGSTPS